MSTHCPKCKTKGDFRETIDAYDYFCRTCNDWCSKIKAPNTLTFSFDYALWPEDSHQGTPSIGYPVTHPTTPTSSGRFSGTQPNVQNIPRCGPRFKTGDIVTDGHTRSVIVHVTPIDYLIANVDNCSKNGLGPTYTLQHHELDNNNTYKLTQRIKNP